MGDPLAGDMDTTGAGRAMERGMAVNTCIVYLQTTQSVSSHITVIVILSLAVAG